MSEQAPQSNAGRAAWGAKLSGVVGDKTAKPIEQALGYTTVGELLGHYPRTFVERGQTSSVDGLMVGEQATMVAQVRSASTHPYQDRRTKRTAYRTEVALGLEGGEIWMTFFDSRAHVAQWRTEQLRRGVQVLVSGRVDRNRFKQLRWELTHPDYDLSDVDAERSALQPIYPTSGKLRSWAIENTVRIVLDVLGDVPELLPEGLREEHGLLSAARALRFVHQPEDWQQFHAGAKRLRFDEAFVAQVALAQRRLRQREQSTTPRTGRVGGLFDLFDERLPFTLTTGQQTVEETLLADLAQPHPMHRLLQGEVGSGKTVVALRAMLRVVDSGGQAALLAPTEVLAQQHHRSITAMLGDLAAAGMLGGADDGTRVALLTGSMGTAARRAALLEVASGEAGIVVGTHALLEDVVQFADLGLVVVDEQHRFGVEQRAALTGKANGAAPHVLVMTATPIPRTVAMTVFGDLETSALTELPAGRAPIQSIVVPLAEQPGWWDRVWGRVREEVEKGHQVYVVCPRIGGEDSDTVSETGDRLLGDDEDAGTDAGKAEKRPLAAVEEVAPSLLTGPLAGLRVEALHGRLPADRKDEVMRAFAAGDVDVLVSTTVIEVGVDVGNATTMVILDADRFGISQLHQLRGRVGRGGHPGLCLLVTGMPGETRARERLDAVAGTLDGFELARLDLEQRKEGDVLGANQSGSRRTLRLLSVLRDEEVILAAREAATAAVHDDPALAGLPALRAALAALEETHRIDYLDKA